MKVEITGRHVEITPALREFTEAKLVKLQRLLDEPLEVHVVVWIEKHRHHAEIKAKARHILLSGSQETGDLYASIGEVIDKLERQAQKHKEKLTDHKHRKGPRNLEAAASIEASVREVDGDNEPTSAAATAAPARVVRSQKYRAKPLSAEDALLELEATGEDVLVFRDAQTDRVHVVYRQKDGNFALVEPDA